MPPIADTQSVEEQLNDGAPASVAENIDKIVRTEEEAISRRSRGEAITAAIGAFVGTIPFIILQIMVCVFRGKSARHSEAMSATDSDLMSAIPI
jgi:uncharacterized membrane protein